MKVIDREGNAQAVSYDAIKERILRLASMDPTNTSTSTDIDLDEVVIQTIAGIYDGISTKDLDNLSARICATMQSVHYGYDVLASCITSSNTSKCVRRKLMLAGFAVDSFSSKMRYLSEQGGVRLHPTFIEFVNSHSTELDAMIDPQRNVRHSFFAIKTMERSYLLRTRDGDIPIESPQDMWLRVAIAVNLTASPSVARIKECYDDMSLGLYTHATPTLFNAGTLYPQCSSCYLMGTEDSMDSIWKTIKDAAQISKWAGGIGVHISNVRAKGSRINTTNGVSDGIVPMLRCYNDMVRYCNQAGRRKGSLAAYLEPWHADVWEFVELRRNTGSETERARDIFLALWVPDEFMRRVEADEPWYLMTPDLCPGLIDAVGDSFSELYTRYISEGRFVKEIRARTLWQHIIACQLETGTPYILYKDHVNRKCNQSNIGTIRSSNLCAEITEYSDSSTYAVCNLASIAVNSFVMDGLVNHAKLHECAKKVTRNLNNIIDMNMYPVPETRLNNLALRPIGIGIQGMGDIYCMLGLPYEDSRAIELDREIMETIYHASMEASIELAEECGEPYQWFEGSPLSQGKFQFDMWDCCGYVKKYDWDALRTRVMSSGARNSLLTALMPTASTSQILGNCECFEPFQSNLYKRNTLAGEFIVINRHLMKALMHLGQWTPEIRQRIMQNDGSVQGIMEIPADIRTVYKTVWELPQKSIIDHAVARGPFVCQSQSMNLFMAPPSFQKISSALIYAWKNGLKTGMYYLRSSAAVEAKRVEYDISERHFSEKKSCMDEVCTMCTA